MKNKKGIIINKGKLTGIFCERNDNYMHKAIEELKEMSFCEKLEHGMKEALDIVGANKASKVQDDVLKLYSQNYTINEIVEKTGISKNNVHNIISSI